MTLRILTEASGSLVIGYLIKAIQEAGHISVASDIDSHCVGRYLADDFVLMPSKNDPHLWQKISQILVESKVDFVIPSFDETLLGWAERKHHFSKLGITVAISEPDVIKTFVDKWLTFQFLIENSIPTPRTSLVQDFPLVKPRYGHGGQGVYIPGKPIAMDGLLSQEIAEGEEYTVDVFCDGKSNPLYIVPRKRISVRDGKSTQGVVVYHKEIIEMVTRLCKAAGFIGPINVQCFSSGANEVSVIEVNPRIAGGMALGFAATENWISLLCDCLLSDKIVQPKPVKYGLQMMRYYAELFVPTN
ncbi:MAG: ATP-grasp domain-containing protein [Sulfuricellaceae bacterium]